MLFLVEAVKQMQAGGAKLSFGNINIPGRTQKALTHLWDKLSKECTVESVTAAEAGEPSSVASTPVAKRGATSKLFSFFSRHFSHRK
jgi:hypothetical protein